MDKVARYKQIARRIIEEVAALDPSTDSIENQLILDDEHGHYMLYLAGWQKTNRFYGSLIHIDVKIDGTVWLQHDGTDLIIARWLVQYGVDKADIVLGFHAPSERVPLEELLLT